LVNQPDGFADMPINAFLLPAEACTLFPPKLIADVAVPPEQISPHLINPYNLTHTSTGIVRGAQKRKRPVPVASSNKPICNAAFPNASPNNVNVLTAKPNKQVFLQAAR